MSKTEDYLLGIDMGTGGARASLITPSGKHIATGAAEWSTSHPRPGRAEQDPDEWWRCIVKAVRQAMDGIDPDRVVAVSHDATSATVVFCDADGKHLRPAIMWMDVRAVEESAELGKTGDPGLKYAAGAPVSAEWGTPKLMWVKKNEPEIWAKSEVITDCPSWLTHRLSGRWVFDECAASCKYFYDANWDGWPTSLYEAVNLSDVFDKFASDVVPLGEQVGQLTAAAAEELGLKAGIPVGAGGIDAHVGGVGLGMVNPGVVALITGSSHVMLAQTDRALYTQGIWGAYYNAVIPGQYTLEAGQASTGSISVWFREFAAKSAAQAAKEGVHIYTVLEREAQKLPPGADGVMVLDHFQGNRSPFSDPLSRGVIAGLTLGTTEAQIYRAITEAVCFGTATIFDTMAAHGLPMTEVRVAGGPTRSQYWMQMHADVTGLPMVFTEFTEGPLMGSAMLAAVAAGIHADIPAAAKTMVKVARTLEPNAETHAEYQQLRELYMQTYQSLKPTLHALAKRAS